MEPGQPARTRRYRQGHREKVNAAQRVYYDKNREEKQAYHRAYQQGREQEFMARINDIKLARGCDRCGYRKTAVALAWHHREGEKKDGAVSRMAHRGGHSWERLLAEMAKCDVLCHNCHAEEHWG